MREYIKIDNLDPIDFNNITPSSFLPITIESLTYRISASEFRDYVIDIIDTSNPVYNANQIQGAGIESFTGLGDYQLLTYDTVLNAWTNRELDLDAVFRFPEFVAGKFVKLDPSTKEVITSDVHVLDLVVEDPVEADKFLVVDNIGSSVVYVDINTIIDPKIDDLRTELTALIDAEEQRAISEEQRIEGLLNDLSTELANEIIRVEGLIQDEETRAISEEQRIENKIDTSLGDYEPSHHFIFTPTINAGSTFTINSTDIQNISDCRLAIVSIKVQDVVSGSPTETKFINSEGSITAAYDTTSIVLHNETAYNLPTHISVFVIKGVGV